MATSPSKYTKVEMHELGSAKAPGTIYTLGLGPCLGVAIEHGKEGFILHSPDIFMESETTNDFFALLEERIPANARPSVVPILTGCALIEVIDPQDEEANNDTKKCREEIVRRLAETGFAKPNIRWTKEDEISSLFIDLDRRVILRETLNMPTMDEKPPEVEFFPS